MFECLNHRGFNMGKLRRNSSKVSTIARAAWHRAAEIIDTSHRPLIIHPKNQGECLAD